MGEILRVCPICREFECKSGHVLKFDCSPIVKFHLEYENGSKGFI